jgi:hypothetical protein
MRGVTAVFGAAPAALVIVGFLGALFAGYLLGLLTWYAVQRMRDQPRVPLRAATYLILVILCAGLFGVSISGLGAAGLFRDHEPAAGKQRLGRLRCEKIAAGRARATFTPSEPLAGAPETYEIEGETCALSIALVRLRALPAALGASTTLSRVERVGPVERPRRNPPWLTPGASSRPRPLDLVVSEVRYPSLSLPAVTAGSQDLVISSDGPALEKRND